MATPLPQKSHSPLRPLRKLAPFLLGWYDTVHTNRDMPWRQTSDPYAIWLSETMLQQTQVATVKPYYHRFLARFPTVAALAAAEVDAVLALWAGLGYYRRARHLHAAAKAMVQWHAGRVPETLEGLLELPGVGRYTAGAVASIAFGLPAPVVDGNVMRVLARLTGFERNIADPKNAAFFWEAAEEVVRGCIEPQKPGQSRPGAHAGGTSGIVPVLNGHAQQANGRFGDINQAMMELGATICAPARPACLLCPVKSFCRAFAEGRQMELPVKAKKKPVPEVRGVAVVVLRKLKAHHSRRNASGRAPRHAKAEADAGAWEVLMMKRPAGVTWEGMWEFPVISGRARAESDAQGDRAVATGLEEPLGLRLAQVRSCGEVVHTLTHRRMVYEVICCTSMGGGDVDLPECPEGGTYTESQWVRWPLEKHSGVAFGRVVEKLAEVVAGSRAGGAQYPPPMSPPP